MLVLGFIAITVLTLVVIRYGLRWAHESQRRYRETGVIWFRGMRFEGRHGWIGATAATASTLIITLGLLISLLVLAFKLFG